MPAFFDELEAFYGDGSRNEAGETLEEFLEKYDPYKYKNPCSTVDMVVFAAQETPVKKTDGLKVLLIKRKNHPGIGAWALPGGFVELRENLADAAKRELFEETGVKDVAAEQIGTFGDVKRDPRARVITTAYMALVKEKEITVRAGDDAKAAAWFVLHIFKEPGKENGADVYRLTLEEENQREKLCPVVKRKETGTLIKEEEIWVGEQSGTASDHAAILLKAYLVLEERLKRTALHIKEKIEDEME